MAFLMCKTVSTCDLEVVNRDDVPANCILLNSLGTERDSRVIRAFVRELQGFLTLRYTSDNFVSVQA